MGDFAGGVISPDYSRIGRSPPFMGRGAMSAFALIVTNFRAGCGAPVRVWTRSGMRPRDFRPGLAHACFFVEKNSGLSRNVKMLIGRGRCYFNISDMDHVSRGIQGSRYFHVLTGKLLSLRDIV